VVFFIWVGVRSSFWLGEDAPSALIPGPLIGLPGGLRSHDLSNG
jgi:hypothetical protein